MAPRGRQRKVGLKRIDAAVDAMRPLGFSKRLVCQTVNKLLKVYEGDEGWFFIEEASYKLLIETILEDEDNQQPPLLQDNQPPPLLEDSQQQQQQPPLLDDNLEDPLEVQIACQRRGLEIDRFFNQEEEEANLPTTKQSRTYAYGWIVRCHLDNYGEETDAHSHLIFQQYKNIFQTDDPQTNLTRKRRTRWDVRPLNMN